MNRFRANVLPLIRSLAGLVAIVLAAVYLSPEDSGGWPIFLTLDNWVNLLRQVSEIGILALGMTLVILTAGIDLSVGSVLALGATITASILMQWSPAIDPTQHIAIAVFLSLATCALVGAVNGIVISQLSVQPFVVTLAAMIGVRGLARWLSSNRNIGLSFDETHVSGQFSSFVSRPWFVIVAYLACGIVCAVLLTRTVFGRYLRALGDNALAAKYAGLPIKRIQVGVYMLAGLLAGIAGVLHCAQNSQGNPNDGVAYELDAIAAVVIGGTSLMGGKGTILGTIIGTLILGVITNILGLNGVDENIKWMAKAVIIVIAVVIQQPGAFAGVAAWWGKGRS